MKINPLLKSWLLCCIILNYTQIYASDFLEKIKSDTEKLSSHQSRFLGTEGHEKAKALIESRIKKAPGINLVKQNFPIIIPITKEATLSIDRGNFKGSHSIFPIYPDNVRTKTTPSEGISGKPVYIGKGHYDELKTHSLKGQIAVIEMSVYAKKTWLRAFEFGAEAVILLGSNDDTALTPYTKAIYKPRYYLPESPLAKALREGSISSLKLKCKVEWESVQAQNIYATIPGTDQSVGRPVIFTASYDAMSIVPDIAPGADNAVDTAFLLNMIDHLSLHPPKRSVLIAFIDGYGFNQLGMREALAMLTITPHDITRIAYEKHNKERLDEYQKIYQQTRDLGKDGVKALSQISDKIVYQKIQRYVKDVGSPEIFYLRELISEYRLEYSHYKKTPDLPEAIEIKEELDRMLKRYGDLNSLINYAIIEGSMPEKFTEEANAVWKEVWDRCEKQLDLLKERNKLFGKYDLVRKQVFEQMGIVESGEVAFPFLIGLDISDSGTTIGPRAFCQFLKTDYTKYARSFTQWLKNNIKAGTKPYSIIPAKNFHAFGMDLHKPNEIKSILDLALNKEAIKGGYSNQTLNPQNMAIISSVANSFQMNGVIWATLEGLRTRLDTPQDTSKKLNWDRLNNQLLATQIVFDLLLNDPSFIPKDYKARAGVYPQWRMPHGSVVTESLAETIARTPKENMLVTTLGSKEEIVDVPGMRSHEFLRSGADGRFSFNPTPLQCTWSARRRTLNAYSLDDAGRIISAITDTSSLLTSHSAAFTALKANPPLIEMRAVIFDCVEVNGPLFRDPRYQNYLVPNTILDVNRGGTPRKYQWKKSHGPMFGLLEPYTRFHIIMGGINKRMALLNVPEDLNEKKQSLRNALTQGFTAEKGLDKLPELISANDFYHIDEWRLQKLESAGVSCKAIREIHDTSKVWLDKAKDAYEKDKSAEHKQAASAALASEIRVYHAVLSMANDVSRGAIFLLLLLVPFSIAMERLLFGSPDIGKQLTKTFLIFLVMFGALFSFHPGFKISSNPAVILIAFMVLLLSSAVINMILSKFKKDMEEIRRGSLAESSGAQTSRGGLIMSAVWLGIANMRKRFMRTMLTGLTIVLVTFTLLCFTSSSTYQDKRITNIDGVKATHNGILMQHPANQKLDIDTVDSIANMMGSDKTVIGRYWATSLDPNDNSKWRLHLRNPATNKLVELKSGLGLSAIENQFSNIDTVLKKWNHFADGKSCYVSINVAEKLGIEPGDQIMVAGTSLKLIATFNPRDLEQKITKLDGQSILPIDYTVEDDNIALAEGESLESEMASSDLVEPDPNLTYVSGDETIILPQGLVKRLNGTLRTIAISSKTQDAKTLANELMQHTVFPVYFNSEEGVKIMVSTPLMPKAPRKLLIPIVIAALIIFNTMLNSIAERKKEIFIYSSLGLAPRHIGILFLAEALTYGIMGSVFGYVIGQGFATVLTYFDLMGGITLNYSGSNVILTMGLVLLVVVLSAIVPAFMAAKVASPSGELDWKVPKPIDGIITGQLPFTVSTQAAPGLAAFLYEYFYAHLDGAIGNFTSSNLKLSKGEGKSVIKLNATVWPAPYDLGVRQDIEINFDNLNDDICDLNIKLTHGSGQERSWWRLNRVFIENIRNQILGWRNIAPNRMLTYIRSAEKKENEAVLT